MCVLILLTLSSCSAQAPGDGVDDCTGDNAPPYPDNEKTLMDSYHYLQLLPNNGSGNIIPGAVWNDRSLDGNDITNTENPTYVSVLDVQLIIKLLSSLLITFQFQWQQSAGGECQFQVRVCGWRHNRHQNNWLFTQHIRQDFAYNYSVQIKVKVIYELQDCRSHNGCEMGFRLLNYKTNTQQLPSTTGSGYMNTEKYEQFGRARPRKNRLSYSETYPFTLDPSKTGFYVAIRDTGTCVRISRLRVYHYICPAHQEGLVLYHEAHTPLSDSVNVNFSCVDNAESDSDTVACYHNGTWGVPVCKCNVGYENKMTTCDGKSTNSV